MLSAVKPELLFCNDLNSCAVLLSNFLLTSNAAYSSCKYLILANNTVLRGSKSTGLSVSTVPNHARNPGIFVGGGGGPSQYDKKSSDNDFILVLSLFYRSQMVNFEENYHLSRSRGGPTFSRGSNFFQWGGGGGSIAYSL